MTIGNGMPCLLYSVLRQLNFALCFCKSNFLHHLIQSVQCNETIHTVFQSQLLDQLVYLLNFFNQRVLFYLACLLKQKQTYEHVIFHFFFL